MEADVAKPSTSNSPRKPTQKPIYPTGPLRPPPNLTAGELADIFKREGHFDRLRKQLVQDFLDSRSSDDFYDRLDDILHGHLDRLVRQARKSYPPRQPWSSVQAAYEESLREVQRHPLLERTSADVDKRQFPGYVEGVDERLLAIIDVKRKEMGPPPSIEILPKASEPAQDASPTLPSAMTHATTQTTTTTVSQA